MTKNDVMEGRKERLEDFIELAKAGNQIHLNVNLRREIIKQMIHPDESDNMRVEQDMYLLMADFVSPDVEVEGLRVSKVYALSSINADEIEEKTTRYIANERLKMDYQRLRKADILFEEKFF